MSYKWKVRLIGLILLFLVIGGSFYQFVGVQAILTIIAKQGTLVWPMVGPSLLAILLTFFFPFIFNIYARNQDKHRIRYKKFLKTNSIVIMVLSVLTIGFLIFNCLLGSKSGDGPTSMFPYDMLVIAFLILAYSICTFVYQHKAIIYDKKDFDPYGSQHFIVRLLIKAAFYFFAFFAFDRIGAMFSAIIFDVGADNVLALVPLFAVCLALLIEFYAFEIFSVIDDVKFATDVWMVSSISAFVLGIYGTFGCLLNLLGPDSTYIMKLYSQFYGIDRLATKPITLIFISCLAVIPSFICTIIVVVRLSRYWIRKRQRLLKQKEQE